MSNGDHIYIVDDDVSLRHSFAELLKVRTNFSVAEFADGKAWLDAAAHEEPGCLLLDYSMPELSGLDVMARMHELNTLHQVIMITGEGNVSVAVQAMQAGAHDFLEKPVAFETLVEAINRAFERLRSEVNVRLVTARAQEKIAKLKQREREIMLLLADGHPNKIIAHRLDLSVRTVEVYRANLMDKLEVRSLADVIRLAFQSGMLLP